MSIIPVFNRIVGYSAPALPYYLPPISYPVPYIPTWTYPTVYDDNYNQSSIHAIRESYPQILQSYYSPVYQAIYNPGNFYLWPPGQ